MNKDIYEIKKLRNRFLSYYYDEDYEKAQQTGERLISTYRAKKLVTPEEFGKDLFNLACAYDEGGNYEKAVSVYLKAADEIENNRGKCLKLSDVYNNIGIAHDKLHQHDTALAYFKKCYNLRSALLKETDKDLIDACYNLASEYKNLHRFTDAAQYYAKALNSRSKKDIAYGDNLFNLGMCYIETKDFALGGEYMKRAMEVYRQNSKGFEEYINALGFYSAFLYKSRKYEEAVENYNVLIDAIKQNYGTDQHNYANALSQLADCYTKMGSPEKGITLKQKSINIIKKSMGTEHIIYATNLADLGHMYLNLNEYAKAAQLYSEALGIRSKILGVNNKECIDNINTLADIYMSMELYNKAEDIINYALNNLTVNKRVCGETVLHLVKKYMDIQDGEGLRRAYSLFNKIYPEKTFDEMLDIAEDF